MAVNVSVRLKNKQNKQQQPRSHLLKILSTLVITIVKIKTQGERGPPFFVANH